MLWEINVNSQESIWTSLFISAPWQVNKWSECVRFKIPSTSDVPCISNWQYCTLSTHCNHDQQSSTLLFHYRAKDTRVHCGCAGVKLNGCRFLSIFYMPGNRLIIQDKHWLRSFISCQHSLEESEALQFAKVIFSTPKVRGVHNAFTNISNAYRISHYS